MSLIQFQRDMCEALGLDPSVTRSITLKMETRAVPIVEVEQVRIEGDEIVDVLRRYEFTEKVDE